MNIEHYIRIGRLLAELHGDEVLSEQQCAKIMGVDLVSWRIIEHTFSRGSWGETVDESGPTSEEAIRAALASTEAAAGEPIYQVRVPLLDGVVWIDLDESAHERWKAEKYTRTVYTAPPAASGQKLTLEQAFTVGTKYSLASWQVQQIFDACLRASSATASDKVGQS